MPTRRSALKTLAGATVVGSLSGCVKLATQRTVEYNGTPAMYEAWPEKWPGVATGVSVEARRTIERAGITREIVAHSWGMWYGSFWQDGVAVATFTTPSIKIAGQELNPIADLTVGDIGYEFVRTRDKTTGSDDSQIEDPGDVEYSEIEVVGPYVGTITVENATGKKVLRAFRDANSGGDLINPELGNGDILLTDPDDLHWFTGQPVPEEEHANPTPDAAQPHWEGEVREMNISIPDEEAEDLDGALRFDKHDGDFVVAFGAAPKGAEFKPGKNLSEAVKAAITDDDGGTGGIVHPREAEFTEAMLQRHLVGTNLEGSRGLVEQGRKLIDETQDLLAEAKNNTTRNEEDARFTAITVTEDDLKRLDTIMGGLGEDLQELSVDTLVGGSGDDTLRRVQERSEEAETIATRAHDRIASYNNDTRDEEDERFLQIEQHLERLKQTTVAYKVYYKAYRIEEA